MEVVYITLILAGAAAVTGVIYMLRHRITKAEAEISLKERSAKGKIEAVPPSANEAATTIVQEARHRPLVRTGVVGNILTWWSHIRAPLGARVGSNILKWGSTIEVTPNPLSRNSKELSYDSQESKEE